LYWTHKRIKDTEVHLLQTLVSSLANGQLCERNTANIEISFLLTSFMSAVSIPFHRFFVFSLMAGPVAACVPQTFGRRSELN
jgi:hypothetical protein